MPRPSSPTISLISLRWALLGSGADSVGQCRTLSAPDPSRVRHCPHRQPQHERLGKDPVCCHAAVAIGCCTIDLPVAASYASSAASVFVFMGPTMCNRGCRAR